MAASSNCGAVRSGRPDPSHSSNTCKEAELVNLQGPKELIGRKRLGRERKRASVRPNFQSKDSGLVSSTAFPRERRRESSSAAMGKAGGRRN